MPAAKSEAEKFIVMPFRRLKGKLVPAEHRPASSEPIAIRTAENMAPRFAGVIALGIIVDPVTDEVSAPRELVRFGDVPELQDA